MRAKREISPETDELWYEVNWAIPAMQEKTAPWDRRGPQDIHKRTHRAYAMNRERTLEFDGHGELDPKGRFLRDGVMVFHPTI